MRDAIEALKNNKGGIWPSMIHRYGRWHDARKKYRLALDAVRRKSTAAARAGAKGTGLGLPIAKAL